MTIQEKMKIEQANIDKIYLYREGGFWKAYERSAYMFYLHIKKYLVQQKYVKSVDSYVVYLGFPDSKVSDLTREYTVTVPDEKQLVVSSGHSVDPSEFDTWKALIEMKHEEPKPSIAKTETGDAEREAIHRIRNFMLESANPIECLIFVKELKHLLTNGPV